MQLPILPLALDWTDLIIFLFIIGSSLFGRLVQGNRDAQRRRRAAAPDPPVPDAGDPPRRGPTVVIQKPGQRRRLPGPAEEELRRPPVAGPAQTEIEQEIEAFLRKSSGRPEPPPIRPAKPASPPPASHQPRRLVERSRSSDPFPPSESVGEHVHRHIGTGRISEHASDLGRQIGQADERIEDHLRDVFDHKLGTLESSHKRRDISEGTDASVWSDRRGGQPVADHLLEMLSSPQDVGAAVVLAEILKRPEY